MSIIEIEAYIEAIATNSSLYEVRNFDDRIEAIDFIGFDILDQIEEFLRKTSQPGKLISLKGRAEKLKSALEEIDSNLFQRIREDIRMGDCRGQVFKKRIHEYVDVNASCNHLQGEAGYDNLDIFINGLSLIRAMPEQTKDLEPEMVYYQKTPARVVFELVRECHFTKEDVFFDLGSGLGQVVILVNLLTEITAKGVEFEPAFCEYAGDCTAELNLSNVTFINVDARKANYSEGTIFFMYTPFKGEILQDVLAILRNESLRRKIKIITYGPCTAQVALESWLDFATPEESNMYKLSIFSSL